MLSGKKQIYPLSASFIFSGNIFAIVELGGQAILLEAKTKVEQFKAWLMYLRERWLSNTLC